MLNQLVESKNNARENKRKGEFFVTTLAVLITMLAGSWTYSLFAKDYAMGSGELEISNLVAPVAVEPSKAPEPEPDTPPQKTENSKSDKIILKDLYEDISRSSTPPKELTGQKDVINARQFDLSKVDRGPINQIPVNGASRSSGGDSSDAGCGLCDNSSQAGEDENKEKELKVVKPTPKDTPKTPPTKTLGVVNGIASNLVKPPYPASARLIRAEGAVNVQVLIDEKGNVVSATAVSGHPLLRPAAVQAARQSKFTPTLLSNQAVKVTGVIIYNFKAQ